MGLVYHLECPKCGYSFTALYKCGGSQEQHIRAGERLESGIKGDEPTRVYQIMKKHAKVSVKADTRPYWCRKCRSFYNYDRVIIAGGEGKYTEEDGTCPNCGRRTAGIWSIDMRKLEGKEQYGYGECQCACPKCSSKLMVTAAGLYD